MSYRDGFGAVVLAGGKSTRMGVDKAFLKYCGRTFIEIVVGRALTLTPRVVVCVGQKDRSPFEALLPKGVVVVNDEKSFGTPLAGLLTGFRVLGGGRAALLGCDMPLIRAEALRLVAELSIGHSAAVPRWPDGEVEPLFAVYDVPATLEAAERALRFGELSLKGLLERLEGVRYVGVDELRAVDPALESLVNVNTPEEYRALKARESSLGCPQAYPERS